MQRSYHFPETDRATTLSDSEMLQLTTRARVQNFSDGQFVQHQGDVGHAIWAVVEGNVTVGRFSSDGDFTHFAVLGKGDLFGELAFFTQVPRQVDAIATGTAKLIAIDRPLLRRLMSNDVEWAELLLRSLSRQLAGALNIIDDERRLTTLQRLLALLQSMAADGEKANEVTATQQQLADLLGVSRVTLGAALRGLTAAGAVKPGYGRIWLLGDRTSGISK